MSSAVSATQNLITCPATLSCNYNNGICDAPTGIWRLQPDSAFESFVGSQTMNLSRIWGNKLDHHLSPHVICCVHTIMGEIPLLLLGLL